MTETRLKELQTEIARLQELDKRISDRVNREWSEEQECWVPSNKVACSSDLDLLMYNESI